MKLFDAEVWRENLYFPYCPSIFPSLQVMIISLSESQMFKCYCPFISLFMAGLINYNIETWCFSLLWFWIGFFISMKHLTLALKRSLYFLIEYYLAIKNKPFKILRKSAVTQIISPVGFFCCHNMNLRFLQILLELLELWHRTVLYPFLLNVSRTDFCQTSCYPHYSAFVRRAHLSLPPAYRGWKSAGQGPHLSLFF